MSELEELEKAIAALEAQRAILGNAVVDASQAALREKAAALAAAEPADRDRRQISVLFADVVGSTAIIRELDPEDNLALMEGALQQLARPITEHGGRVVRFMGDGLLAIFGHPIASENDPDSAVRAGLALVELAQEYGAELADRWGIGGFNVRVGIATGMVAIAPGSEGKDTLAGATVNLAARLESAAAPGSVLISTTTYRHILGAFDLESGQPLAARGFPAPVPVYRVLREKPRSFRTRRRGVEGIETQMIGRRRELEQLKALFTAVQDTRTHRQVTIVGDAGIGKSRLMFEFKGWVDLRPETVRLYRGRARVESQGQPFGLVRDIFATRFEVQDDDPIQVARQKTVAGFEEALGAGDQTREKALLVAGLLGYGQAAAQEDARQVRDRALAYLIDYFTAAAAATPLLLMLDDLHWADDSSLDMLAGIAPAVSHLCLFVAGTARPELYERRPEWGAGLPFHTRLDLKPLSGADSERLVDELLQKAQHVPPELKRLVVDKTGGNPYFVEEVIKMLVDDGAIVKDQEIWLIHPEELGQIQMPSTLTGVLQARLASLPWQERAALEQASVIGRIFWEDTIRFLNESRQIEPAVDPVHPVLEALLAREMIFRRPTSTFKDTAEYIFKNAVMREVTYERVLKQARRAYHGLVAQWLIGRSGERQEEFSGLIAGHLGRAGQNTEAVVYLEQAGKAAAARYANEEAIEYFSQALRLLPEQDYANRFNLLLAREPLYKRLGRREQQQDDLEMLQSLADRQGQLDDQLEVSLRWATLHSDAGNYEVGADLAAGVVEQAGKRGQASLAARGEALLARLLLAQGQYKASESHALTALQGFVQTGESLRRGQMLNHLGGIVFYQGDFAAARDYYQQALEVFQALADREGEAFALNNLGNVAVEHGDYDTAWQHYEDALAIHREVHRRFGEELVLGNLGGVAIWRGDPEEGRRHYQAGLAIAEEIGDEEGKAWMFDGLGDAELMMDRPQEAFNYYQQALAIREELGQQHLAYFSRAGLAQALLAQGRAAEAQKQLQPVLEYLDGGGRLNSITASWIHLACVQALSASDDPGAAAMLQMAYTDLQQRAATINDPAYRRSFLENIPWNRQINHLWQIANQES